MAVINEVQIEEVSKEEGFKILDEAARHYLDMPGEKFLELWFAGEFADRVDTPEVITVAMLIPFAA